MNEERIKNLLEIPQVVEIIKKFGLIIKTDVNNILNMACINDISVDLVNKIQIREDGRKQLDQTSKYTILKNGAYYVHHYWNKNKKVRGDLTMPCPLYGYEGCGFKLVMQNFICKLLPKKKRRRVEVDFDVIWSTIQVGKDG